MKTVIFVTAFLLYACTAASTLLSYGDAAELVTASYTLGVAHPPGFPLYMLLGKLFATCMPWGDVAHRYSLLMGLYGAGCVTVVCATLRCLGCAIGPAVAAASVLACSYDFWLASVTPEVTILNSLLGAMLVGLSAAAVMEPSRAVRLSYIAAALLGLSLTHHPTIVLLLPVMAVAFCPMLMAGWQRVPVLGALCTICFALPYSYIPWAAQRHPAVNHLSEPGAHGMWRFVTRQAYGSWQLAGGFTTWSWGMVSDAMAFYARALWQNFTWAGLALAIVGAWWLMRRQLRFALGLGTAFLLSGPLFLALTRMPVESFTTQGIFAKFFGLSFVCLTLCLGMGGHALTNWGCQRWGRAFRWTPTVLIASLAVYLGVFNYQRVDKSHFTLSRNYAHDLFTSLPQGAIVVIHGDNSLFCGWYLQQVAGERQDLTVLNAARVDVFSLLRDNVGKRPTFEIGIPGKSFAALGLQSNPYAVMPWGLAMEVVPANTPYRDDTKVWERFVFREDVTVHTYQDAFAQEIVYFYAAAHFNKAVLIMGQPEYKRLAHEELARALRLYPEFAIAKQVQARHAVSQN